MPTMHDSASALALYVTDGMAKTVGELVTVKTWTEGIGSALVRMTSRGGAFFALWLIQPLFVVKIPLVNLG